MPLLQYVFYAKQVPPDILDQELDDMNNGVEKHLIAIATELMDWESVAPQLNIKHTFVDDIKDKYPKSPVEQR